MEKLKIGLQTIQLKDSMGMAGKRFALMDTMSKKLMKQ